MIRGYSNDGSFTVYCNECLTIMVNSYSVISVRSLIIPLFSEKKCLQLCCLYFFQYAGQWTSYNHALSYLLKDPKHRAKAKQIAIADGRLNISKYEVGRRLTRDELKEREEQLLRDILKETVELR